MYWYNSYLFYRFIVFSSASFVNRNFWKFSVDKLFKA